MTIRAVLCDVEGTTTDIAFVHDVLFPLSRDRMDAFVRDHWSDPLIKQIEGSPEETAETLKRWILEDRKETILKSIQGKIWREAFESGELKGHVYEDVPLQWRTWRQFGIRIYIYSSGSAEAQRLLFHYSTAFLIISFSDPMYHVLLLQSTQGLHILLHPLRYARL